MQHYGSSYSLVGSTGTMAAALGANSIVFAMQAALNDAARPNIPGRGPVAVTGIRATYTTIVASATPVAAGRALQLFKGLNAAQAHPLGGTALVPVADRTLNSAADNGLAASPRIAASAGLTVVGFTRAAAALATLDLVAAGSAGSRVEKDFLPDDGSPPIFLDPGEILCISNPAAFDAAMTWQLTVEIDYYRRDSL